MSDNTLTVTEVVNSVTVTPVNNTVTVSDVGVQGPAGATGATGATGAQGSSGVVTVNAPLTNAGTSSAADLSISAGTTSAVGVLQLTDSTSSTSTTTAATPNAVKTAYDYADTRTFSIVVPSGSYLQTPSGSYTNLGATANRSNYLPIYLPTSTSFDRIAVMTSSTFSGTAVVRMGIYAHNASTGKPSTLILDAGTVSCTASTTIYSITISQTLSAGFYWVVMNTQTAATINNFNGSTGSTTNLTVLLPYRSLPSGNLTTGWAQNSVTGAFADAANLVTMGSAPFTWLRVA
jgi:hypothetical protein